MASDPARKAFYDERRGETYDHELSREDPREHAQFRALSAFVERYGLSSGKRCLEIGCGRGLFQDMVEDYQGVDIAESLRPYLHKPYTVVEGSRYPFPDESFDAIWSLHVYEHIPNLQEAMEEIVRLLRPGGVLFFAPAWQCRSWAAEGYPVRPWSDFGLWGKMIKASIPLRNSVLWRSLFLFPKRLWRHAAFLAGAHGGAMDYKKLTPNWDHYWMADSDACNHIDPHDAILWFEGKGLRCVSHPMHLRAFLVRTGAVIFQKAGR